MAGGYCVLNEVYDTIVDRLRRKPETSYTARLASMGTPMVARKVGEESVEVVVEALAGDAERLAEEAADLLYHLLVLLAMVGVEPSKVEEVMRGRMR